MAVEKVLIVCVFLSSLPYSLSQCPANTTVTVSMGMPVFQPLPRGAPLRTTGDYNAGGLSLWYSLAAGIVDVARPGGLPYGKKWGSIIYTMPAVRVHARCLLYDANTV